MLKVPPAQDCQRCLLSALPVSGPGLLSRGNNDWISCVFLLLHSFLQIEHLLEDLCSLQSRGSGHLSAINNLRKLCNSPQLCMSLPGQGDGGPPTWEEQSGKLSALTCLLLAIKQSGGERVVVVSLFTAMLDIIQELCDRYNIIFIDSKLI